MPSLPSTPRKVPSGHETKSSIWYLHSPTIRPKDIVRLSGDPLIQDSPTTEDDDDEEEEENNPSPDKGKKKRAAPSILEVEAPKKGKGPLVGSSAWDVESRPEPRPRTKPRSTS